MGISERKGVRRMKLKRKDWRQASQILMGLSVLAVVLAGWGFAVADIWLASTQWLLVAAIIACFGIYIKLES